MRLKPALKAVLSLLIVVVSMERRRYAHALPPEPIAMDGGDGSKSGFYCNYAISGPTSDIDRQQQMQDERKKTGKKFAAAAGGPETKDLMLSVLDSALKLVKRKRKSKNKLQSTVKDDSSTGGRQDKCPAKGCTNQVFQSSCHQTRSDGGISNDEGNDRETGSNRQNHNRNPDDAVDSHREFETQPRSDDQKQAADDQNNRENGAEEEQEECRTAGRFLPANSAVDVASKGPETEEWPPTCFPDAVSVRIPQRPPGIRASTPKASTSDVKAGTAAADNKIDERSDKSAETGDGNNRKKHTFKKAAVIIFKFAPTPRQ